MNNIFIALKNENVVKVLFQQRNSCRIGTSTAGKYKKWPDIGHH